MMESDIHADQNFYRRRPVPPPASSEHDHGHGHDHEQQLELDHQRSYSPPPLPDFDARSPQLPPKLPFLTTQNLQAVSSNGYVGGVAGDDPDDFYKQYRGVQSSSYGYADITNGMAATVSESRQGPSSLRSNGNGTTPKHPPLSATRNSNALKPAYRSASSPLDGRTTLSSAKSTPALNGPLKSAQQPSVKDLLKRFDQNNESSAPPVRKPTARIPTNPSGTYARSRAPNGASNTLGGSRAGQATRDTGVGASNHSPVSRATQRTRFTPEDQHSNNTLSSVARAGKPRVAVPSSNGHASKSMTNLSPTSSNTPPQPSPPQTRRPLFGEVSSTGQVNLPDVSYGLANGAARRISDSNLRHFSHNRSRSDVEIPPSPSSPTAWYRGVTPNLDDVDANTSSRLMNGHNRAHSDSMDAKANPLNGVNTSTFRPSTAKATSTRLPLAAKRFNTPSNSPSPPSTRAGSPYTNRNFANGKVRKQEQWQGSPGRSTTPTNGRALSPTNRTPRGKARSPGKVATNNGSLQAYISAPPPKTSPPLRSSRPRQPVSSASTASSRQKASDRSVVREAGRSGSPKAVRTGMRVTRNPPDNSPKPRKIPDTGPVDFAARREKVQRAYTKSINKSEQEATRAANLRRLNERKLAAERSKKEGEVVTAEIAEPVDPPSEVPAQPLQITTDFSPPNWTTRTPQIAPDQDSPTLGIPGSFPGERTMYDDDEAPPSAISNVTGTTEIDNEPQTTPARMSRMTSTRRLEPSLLSQQFQVPDSSADIPSQEKVEDEINNKDETYNADTAIPIVLDVATPIEEALPEAVVVPKSPSPPGAFQQDSDFVAYDEPTSPYDPLTHDPSPPGAFQEDSPDLAERDQPVFATTVTSASPLEGRPELSGAVTPLESCDEDNSPHDDLHDDAPVEDLGQSTHSDFVAVEYTTPMEEELGGQGSDESGVHLELPMLRSALAAQRDSDYLQTPTTDVEYESSDGHASVWGNGAVPRVHNRLNQLSPGMYQDNRQSAWTDYSVDTGDEFSDQDYAYQHSPLPLDLSLADPEKRPVPPPKESPVVPPKPDNYTPQTSPRFPKEIPRLESPSHQLPPVSTGTGLGLGFTDSSTPGYGAQVTSVISLWSPEYPPPPVPQEPVGDIVNEVPTQSPPPPSLYNRQNPSSTHRSSHYDSRRPSDDVYSPRPSSSTRRSSAQVSVEDVSTTQLSFDGVTPTVATSFETEEDKKAAEKEKKRLFQRYHIIKELIETESVYLKDMNVVEEIYKGTAEACPKLEETDVKAIFRNTDEVVAFTTAFLDELKAAGSSVFTTRKHKKRESRSTTVSTIASESRFSTAETLSNETDDQKDRKTFIGRTFGKHLKKMQGVYTDFLKNSELASTRLTALQADPSVKVWLQECNLVAKDLTQAWSLDALLVKPVQRITRYKLILADLSKHTPENHPDHQSIQSAIHELDNLLKNIDDLKRRIDMVGKIIGRKRKESDVRSGIAKAFGRRAEKVQPNGHRPNDDEAYLKLHEKYQDDYLRLQVVLRDVEFYTRQATSYVSDFLRYLSSIELVMRLSASPYPEIESKWARFNMGMRDMGTVALEDHLNAIRTRVIQPFEQVIQLYSAPGLAMKKRNKRRLDFEKSLQLKNAGKKIDEKLGELVDQYEALNETLKFELPKLSAMTEKIGNICLGQFVSIQAQWFDTWQEKVKVVLEESQMPRNIEDIVDMFSRDYKYVEAKTQELGIINGTFLDGSPTTIRGSQSIRDDASMKSKGRPSNLSNRPRGLSIKSDTSPSLPTPDFAKRNSGQFTFSPIVSNAPGLPHTAPREPYSNGHSRAGSGSPATLDGLNKYGLPSAGRPSTGRSYTSTDGLQRPSNDYNEPHRRQSGSTHNSAHHDGTLPSTRPYSGLFNSAMPLPDGPEDSQRSSRASSRDRNVSGGYNVLYLAASLFEFNISATKSEAGYPYLTYQAGEIFDVIGEKGELWLAKNQDDPSDEVGWIWSKHFARLATD